MIRFNILNHIPFGGCATASQVELSKPEHYQLFALVSTNKLGSLLYVDDFELRVVVIFSRWTVS